MSAVTIQQMADRIAGLMEERLGVRGKGLSEKLRRGGRLLPRSVRAQAKELADLAEKSKNPKLLVQIDQARVATCYDTCLRHLTSLRYGSARLRLLISVAATLALGLLVLGGVILMVQRMKGGI
ncbi:MAG: hypothetical protein U0934_11860 [Pseudotabrizicola sp.]|uniref:hypothetical protein n=1 Tax=Pseudotabrizicola sp. TaxID=2939647 RepID=UPI002720BCAB|nr:hypothetical protein [Pseudotabrizicola sp.]MDO8882042.1 hypothetical protein [Pseudotabrizicola sp.]MDP2080782.1 hypothetical protein [Pseudotabrizicola sp.]MDZ7574632.1 hypothetical protein [Pseudotabrizicola sp.]